MPQVPKLAGPGELSNVTPGAYGTHRAPDYTQARQSAELGQAAGQLARGLDELGQRQANDTFVKVEAEWSAYQQEYMRTRQNGNAQGLIAESTKWWDDKRTQLSETMGPLAKGYGAQLLERSRVRGITHATQFENQQLERAADMSNMAAKGTLKSSAAADPYVMVPSANRQELVTNTDAAVQDLRKQNAQAVARKGITDPAVLQTMNREDETDLHTQVIQGLARNRPDLARQHFDKYKKDIDGTKYDTIEKILANGDETMTAQVEGAKLARKYNYTQTTEAIKDIDEMNLPAPTKKAVRAELEHRHAVAKADADSADAKNLNTMVSAYANGASLAQIRKMPEFAAMRDGGAGITRYVEDRQYQASLRGEAERVRAEREQVRKMYGAYQAYSDPNTIAAMSRDEIQLLLPTLGPQLTEHLLNRKDSQVKNPLGLTEARMDAQDFNHLADQFGLKPYATKKTEEEKRQLGELQYRVEQLVSQAQQAKKSPLTREEKMGLMRNEMTRTATVDAPLWFSDKEKPIVALTPEDARRVKIPDAERSKVAEALRQMYDANPTNPAYAPSEENMRRLYLRTRSRAAYLIENGQ